MTTTPNMALELPTNGADIGTWGTKLNVALPIIDSHNHAPGQGVQIGAAGLNIDGNVSFNDFAIRSAGQVGFSSVDPLTSGDRVVFVSADDNELYWRTNGGTNVKLTNGNALNVAAFVGGIGGDYTAVAAAVAYDDATGAYTFKRGTANSNSWARLRAADLRLYEYNTTETVYTAIKAASGLAASYDITLPTALPAAQVLQQIDAAGQTVYSNTLAANQSITVSGTGQYKHGDRKCSRTYFLNDAITISGAGHSYGLTGNAHYISVAAAAETRFQLHGLRQGMRIKKIEIFGTSANEPNFTFTLQVANAAASLTYTSTGTIVANNRKVFTLDSPLTVMIGDDEAVFCRISAVTTAFLVYTIQYIYDEV